MKTAVYKYGDNLYINVTNRCSNACEFCIRNGREGVNGSNLWLDDEPTADEIIMALIATKDLMLASQVVFCGFGEPTYKMEVISKVGSFLKQNSKIIRINTNGQANLINGRDVSGELIESVDIINISLNASNSKKYQEICKSEFGEKAFDSLLEFAVLCKNKGAKVIFSVVDVIGKEEIEKCYALANKLGIELKVRTYE